MKRARRPSSDIELAGTSQDADSQHLLDARYQHPTRSPAGDREFVLLEPGAGFFSVRAIFGVAAVLLLVIFSWSARASPQPTRACGFRCNSWKSALFVDCRSSISGDLKLCQVV